MNSSWVEHVKMCFLQLLRWRDFTMTSSCLGERRNILLIGEICSNCVGAPALHSFKQRIQKKESLYCTVSMGSITQDPGRHLL